MRFGGVVFVLLFSLTPLLWALVVSLTGTPDLILRGKLDLTLRNYVDILVMEDLHFLDYLRNSILISSISALISLALSVLSSYSLTRFGVRGSFPVLLTVLGVTLFPQVSVAGFLYKVFSALGIINTHAALVLTYTAWSLPLGIWVMYAYFSSIPKEIDMAALVDGASRLRILLQVLLPPSVPGLVATYILLFLFSFNEFLFALMFTFDHSVRTVPVGIALFEGIHGQVPWGYITAASFISVAPVILMVLLIQRHIVRGLTGGAVKG